MNPKNLSVIELHKSGSKPINIARALNLAPTTVYSIIERFKKTGRVERKVGSGRRRFVRTPALVQAIRSRIKRNPIRSMRKMARELKVGATTVRKVVKDDLKAKSRARTKKQLITESCKLKRLVRCKKLRSALKKGAPVILFSDEKIFTVDAVSNGRNDRYISPMRPEDVPANIRHRFTTKHPAGIMVFGLVASNGLKMPPVFIEQGLKVNTDVYLNILETKVKPWIKANFNAKTKIIFQQDGAPAHTAKRTQIWLKSNLPDCWDKEIWPPSRPDLNPMDYSVWAWIEERACSKPHGSVTSLKSSIKKEWSLMSEEYIKTVCSRFRHRVEAVIAKDGGYFE